MPLLIDGHNLIGQMPDLHLSDPDDEEKLIARLSAFAERVQKRMTVVFDPNPHDNTPRIGHGKSQHGRLHVVFAPAGKKADDIIRHLAGETKDKQGLVVVTSDAAVADFTRRCGIRVQSSQDFIKWMKAESSEKSRGTVKPVGSAKEVTNWADVFKEPEETPEDRKRKAILAPKPKKGQKRSEQLKEQAKKIRPLF